VYLFCFSPWRYCIDRVAPPTRSPSSKPCGLPDRLCKFFCASLMRLVCLGVTPNSSPVACLVKKRSPSSWAPCLQGSVPFLIRFPKSRLASLCDPLQGSSSFLAHRRMDSNRILASFRSNLRLRINSPPSPLPGSFRPLPFKCRETFSSLMPSRSKNYRPHAPPHGLVWFSSAGPRSTVPFFPVPNRRLFLGMSFCPPDLQFHSSVSFTDSDLMKLKFPRATSPCIRGYTC